MRKFLFVFLFLFLVNILYNCDKSKSIPETKAPESSVNAENERGAYLSKYDEIADLGQYIFPEMGVVPEKYWNCVSALDGNRNDLSQSGETEGLQYHLLCQSISGLTNRAVSQGQSKVAVWLNDPEYRESYKVSLEALHSLGVKELGQQTGAELAKNNYGLVDGINVQIRDLFDGYVLTDVENNPESNIVASVASHVYNSIIVDIRDKDQYDAAGYKMTYDARFKTTKDAWKEFKDKCNNKALVVMPVQTGELRDFAIANGFFVLNINKVKGNPALGQNLDVFEEALKWLEPGAPVFGWEQDVSEDLFVNRASRTGHVWVPSDWMYNIPLTSTVYKQRQKSTLAKVINPLSVDFSEKKNFVSFWLTDGDNVQWMMNDFVENFYKDSNAAEMKMGFGVPVGNLSMASPVWFDHLINQQNDNYTLIEALGGGYSYVDNYGIDNNRKQLLSTLAKNTAAHMRQHRIKVLGLMAHDVKSAEAMVGYKAFIEANDQLEGIVVIQYSPYAGGEGDIYWAKNKNGFDIPIITAKYSLWNHGANNHTHEGTPAFIANKLKSEAKDISFSLVAVHAWSQFKNIGISNDELEENQGGDIKGAGAAKLCADRLDSSFEIVNPQELIWRIRMHYKESQTKQYLSVIE